MELLWVHAAQAEARGLGRLSGRVVEVGVGKVPAAANLTSALHAKRPELVIAFGVCGVYPPDHGGMGPELSVGDVALVKTDVLADEGVQTPRGFLDLSDLGLGEAEVLEADPKRTRAWADAHGLPVVAAATVSTCSGDDASSRRIAQRTGARIETMENGAVAWVCRAAGIPWVSVRAVSNRTGDRDRAGWDLELALANLHRTLGALADEWT